MDTSEENSLTNKQVYQLCTAMCLLNKDFLRPLLSGGLEKRYSLHPNVFLNDLKNILLDPKTKIKIGKLVDGVYVMEEDQLAKMSKILQTTDFIPSKDWNWLSKAEKTAENISKNINIREVYWTPDEKCDMVVKTDSKSVRIFLGKNLDKKYEATEFFTKIFSTNISLDHLMDHLTNIWCDLLLQLPENLKKYLYVWNFKPNMTWEEFQELYSEKYLGEEIPELRFRYKKFSHFSKDAIRYIPELMEEWKIRKEKAFSDFWLEHIIQILKSVGVDQRDCGFYNPTISSLFNSFLKDHLETEGYDNFYLSTGGERLSVYNDSDYDGETCVSYKSEDGSFILSLGQDTKKVDFRFDFSSGEMISEPLFRSF